MAQENRGVWLTSIDSNLMFDPIARSTAIRELANLNFNTLYPSVWSWGYTQHPSSVAKNVTGAIVDPRQPDIGGGRKRDPLKEIIDQARQLRMAVMPWFEFGLMAAVIVSEAELGKVLYPDWLKRRLHWVTQRIDGSQIWMEGEHPRVWLNPFHPEVQSFIQQMIVEVVENYDIQGIQLDDHFGLPFGFGYDPFTVDLYRREQGKEPPANPRDPGWIGWRAKKISDFTRRLFRAVKARKPNIRFTLSPNPYSYSISHSLQDWHTWRLDGLIEELILQVYEDNLNQFITVLNQPEVRSALGHIPVSVGVLSGLKRKPVPSQQIRQQVEEIRRRGFSGCSFFFYETLWNVTGETVENRKALFRQLFPTPASRR